MKRILLSFLGIGLFLTGCQSPTTVVPTPLPEPEIPAHYTTYTDEAQLFSISYPPDWETALSFIPDVKKNLEEVLNSIQSGTALEKVSIVFLAGLKSTSGFTPNVNIVVEPMPAGVKTHDKMVEAELKGVQQFVQDYLILTQLKTTVGGKEATIIDAEGTFPGQQGKQRILQMFTLVDKTVWVVTGTPPSGDFDRWAEDLHAVARSLRIFK
ncbi:MAG: hypothetical protein HYX91_06655 [Chloroflexi bacterium]|nr:hypothetical protein [Chloroflexota bacterium]